MAAITQTITIVDKSNKVVSSAKQLKDVFSEAKHAYLARKAEIKAERKRKEEIELAKAIRACSIADDESRSGITSVSRSRRPDGTRRRRSEHEGGREHRSGSNSPPTPGRHMPLGQFNEELYGYEQAQTRSAPSSPGIQTPYGEPNQMLLRRRTDDDLQNARGSSTPPAPLNRSFTAPEVDLDLAYGEYHEEDLASSIYDPQTRAVPDALIVNTREKELNGLVMKCKGLLEEADCAGQSVKAIITHLQANPDAMAAVALTLAEISNIAAKLAPGALTALKGTAPTVMALLAAPEFLIAVGVGVGITVVMFGGYKIIKKIKASAGGGESGNPRQVDLGPGDDLLDVKELDRIEKWRRGIADSGPVDDTGSVVSGTSVEGEFITPYAAQSMGHLPLPKKSSSKKDKDRDGKEKKKHHKKHRDSERDGSSVTGESDGASTRSDGSKKRGSRELIKVKKPSPLRKMFTVTGTSSSTGWEGLSRK